MRECLRLNTLTGESSVGVFQRVSEFVWMDPDNVNAVWVQRSAPFQNAAGDHVVVIRRLSEEELERYGPVPTWLRSI